MMRTNGPEPGGRRTLSLIGLGNFGAFVARHFSSHFELQAHDQRDVSTVAQEVGCPLVSLDQAAKAGRIVLAIPVSSIRSVLRRIHDQLQPGALVVDVASVKLRPLELMADLLPDHVDYVGTHPLFGPQSGASGIEGLKIALCPGRIGAERLARLRGFLSDALRLKVLEVTPEEHDRHMAYVQGLTHLMGWAFKRLNPPDSPLSTLAYDRMLSLQHNVEHDSLELFRTIQSENPFTLDVRRQLIAEMRRLSDEIEKP